jgi:pyruvate kinase
MPRRAKIVCTIGPRSSSPEVLRALVDAGMSVARLNMSHGTHDEHREVIQHLRQLRTAFGSPIGILADLSGPKIRVGKIAEGAINLSRGDEVLFTSDNVVGTSERISVSYPHLSEDVAVEDPILIADGAILARVVGIEGRQVRCRIEKGGRLTDHKGVNFPTTNLQVPSLTDKDRHDLQMVLAEDVDFVALSFVRHAEDIQTLRELIAKSEHSPRIIAKIEKPEALSGFDPILHTSDGIMIARGDLGVETELARVPMVQKDLIARTREAGKPVITATQMLESMVDSPIPTRAEVTDVANAILDGTDAVMLSEETAIGHYPVETVEMMSKIIDSTESSNEKKPPARRSADRDCFSVTEAIGQGSAQVAQELAVSAIIVSTSSGNTASTVARFRPDAPILAGTPSARIAGQLSLTWGVIPMLLPPVESTDQLIEESTTAAYKTGVVGSGDQVVFTAGIPFGVVGGTNLVLVKTLA